MFSWIVSYKAIQIKEKLMQPDTFLIHQKMKDENERFIQ